MQSDYDATQTAIARDGASVISGATDDLRAIKRSLAQPYTPENLVTVTLDESYRLRDDMTLKRIGFDRGWFIHDHDDAEMTPVRVSDGTYYRLDRLGNRREVRVERKRR